MRTGRIGFAIIGSGAIAEFHARAIAAVAGAELRAVHSRTPAGAARFAAAHGCAAEASLAALLARPDVDVVCVTVPSGMHGEIAIQALGAGKHVLCEKPLEITTERVDAMIAAATRANRILAGVFQSRLTEGAQRLKQAVRDGRFGRIALCSGYVKWWRESDYYAGSSWKGTAALDGGGALMNQAIHTVDLLQWLMGIPVRVSARLGTRVHAIEVEDTVAAWLEYPDGALGTIEAATSCYPGSALRIEIAGENGAATLENGAITRWQFRGPAREDDLSAASAMGAAGSGAADPRAIGCEGHRALVEDMVDAIASGRAPSIPAHDARGAVAIVEAIYQSHRLQQPVTLSSRD